MSIPWDDAYLLHLPVIDAQHKQIIAALSELETAVSDGITSAKVEELLTRVQHYAVRHFAIEERHMEESNYPGLARQQAAHQEFREKFTRFQSDYRNAGLSPALLTTMQRELSLWIKQHVTGLDQTFGNYYRHYLQETSGEHGKPA